MLKDSSKCDEARVEPTIIFPKTRAALVHWAKARAASSSETLELANLMVTAFSNETGISKDLAKLVLVSAVEESKQHWSGMVTNRDLDEIAEWVIFRARSLVSWNPV